VVHCQRPQVPSLLVLSALVSLLVFLRDWVLLGGLICRTEHVVPAPRSCHWCHLCQTDDLSYHKQGIRLPRSTPLDLVVAAFEPLLHVQLRLAWVYTMWIGIVIVMNVPCHCQNEYEALELKISDVEAHCSEPGTSLYVVVVDMIPAFLLIGAGCQ
jgi:hypothetical protein